MSNVHAVCLPKQLIKLFQVAQGKVPFADLTEDEITEAGMCLAQIADNDSRDTLLGVLSVHSRSLVETRLRQRVSENQPINPMQGMYWIYDTLTFFRHNVISSEGNLDVWFKPNSLDNLNNLGLSKDDFEFLLREDGKPLDDQTHKSRVEIGKKYFVLLTKVAQAGVRLDNNILSKLFLLEFGGATTFDQEHHEKPEEGIILSKDSPEYKGYITIAKKVLANSSG